MREALDLARSDGGPRVDDDQVAEVSERSHAGTAVGLDLRRDDGCAGSGNDEGDGGLQPVGVARANHGGFEHVRMLYDNRFYFGGLHRDAASFDGGSGLLSTVDDVVAFGRMLLRGGSGVLTPATVRAMTRNQLTESQRSNVWPGFSFLDDRGWGYGVSVCDDGRYTWDGGFGTTWSNIKSLDLTVVVLTQRATDETGPPRIGDHVLRATSP